MKRGLVLAKYGSLAASTRQRFVQSIPYLEAAGITLEFQPLFDNNYLADLFTHGKRDTRKVLRAYVRRLRALVRARDYDFIWVHFELFPYLPGFVEALISLAGKPVIIDFDDAIFHQYDQHPKPLVRHLLRTKLVPLLRRCDIAFCGNAYLEAYVKPHCPRTIIIPTTVDIHHYAAPQQLPTEPPTIGWIGSPSTWKYCLPLAEVVSSFVHAEQARMLVVGANHAASTAYPFAFRHWSEERELADIQAMDIGIMPLPVEPWARVKCCYYLIQYMACGLPVIASPVGVNREIVTHGVNGLLAATPAEWRDAIAQLLGDAALRARMGQAGRASVEKRYSIQHYGPVIAQQIQELLASQV
jgi:glycosyltransferase involved in cell wall biosynthesis